MTSSLGDVLNIQNLRVCYPNTSKWVLDRFNLNIRAGERVALIGSSGSGKSTVAKALMQILPSGSICQGSLLVAGQDLMNLEPKSLVQLRGELVGLVFQDPMSRLNPLMTIGDHILDTLKAHRPEKTSSWRRFRAEELLIKVGINPARFNAFPHQFSGGMRQRLAIALAIALNPPLVIADEPTSSLDVAVANQVMRELNNLCNELGTSLLLITHDLALAARWCERMAILGEGNIVEEGFSRDVVEQPLSLLGKSLVGAVKAREQKSLKSQIEGKVVLKVDRLRCWHAGGWLPWQTNWIKAVDEVSFSLLQGETLGVVGVSGCGKSTLCRALVGLLPIRGGDVMLFGQNLARLNRSSVKQARQALQMIFQDPFGSMNPKMTVLDTISDPLLAHNLCNKASAKEQSRKLLDQVGLSPPENFQHRLPHELSGGQQQRVAIARALALTPKVLICDESVSMLDAEMQADVLNLLSSLQKKLGLAILFITHDLSVAHSFCHRLIVLDKGKIVEEGLSHQIFNKPQNELTKTLVSACPRIKSFN
ncbi:ABC transporter ATP-binding protein [Prochlorococcus marinus]|uniref:ABC transporter, ATP binding component n=1 Tax=Prochlorococcus marinus (strain MIT 9211) TaxID=93059 RepID=A9BDF5_PROM4|nr:ABC transporter ATP-binding protein [Prochlorococcus marinus]ABX08141.1 ABC transporter, ATP binding component [Prochlorococcus marinus str. MIT 9211]